jgi:Gram-negative bacterial TonB protein C-terminal
MLNSTRKNKIAAFFISVFVILCGNLICNSQTVSQDCNFSKYKPISMSHFLPNSIVDKVNPVYPATAKAVKAEGKVRVKILVDLRGRVRQACAIEGHPLLRFASIKAARASRFKPNFGLTLPQKRYGRRFIQDELTYAFKLN